MTTNTTSPTRRSAAHTRDLILAALAEVAAPVTVAELADRAGVAKSTLAKHLPVLEADGAAVRIPGGRDGRRRLPDHWRIAPATFASPDTAAEDDTTPGVGLEDASEPVTPPAPAPAPVLKESAPERAAGTVTATRVGAATGEGPNPVSGSMRLAPGELKLMVKAILDRDPGEELTATAISHILRGRSIGAIQNNLARLAKEERAVQTCERPRRYRSAKGAN